MLIIHDNLIKEVYMILFQGINPPQSNQVCWLTNFIYGLKQASRE